LFRAAEALYYLGRFKESLALLEVLRARLPVDKDVTNAFGRALKCFTEEQSGQCDFKLLQKEAKRLQTPQLDHATYIGSIEIKQTTAKGRGMFTTKAVKAGDLLLCEKAFSHAHED
jgi:hypothetical protein